MVPVIFRAKEIDDALRAFISLEVTETFVLIMMSRRPTGVCRGWPRLARRHSAPAAAQEQGEGGGRSQDGQ